MIICFQLIYIEQYYCKSLQINWCNHNLNWDCWKPKKKHCETQERKLFLKSTKDTSCSMSKQRRFIVSLTILPTAKDIITLFNSILSVFEICLIEASMWNIFKIFSTSIDTWIKFYTSWKHIIIKVIKNVSFSLYRPEKTNSLYVYIRHKRIYSLTTKNRIKNYV